MLDYGCGRGMLTARLCQELNATVWATDHLAAAVRTAERLNAGQPGFQGACSVESIRESAGRFDSIVAVELLEHLTDDGLREFGADAGTTAKWERRLERVGVL